MNTHIKSYRAAISYAYKVALSSTFLSLAAGYVMSQFLLPDEKASFVNELANDEILLETKFSPTICIGHEAIYHAVQVVLEVTVLATGFYAVFGIPNNSRYSSFIFCHANPNTSPAHT